MLRRSPAVRGLVSFVTDVEGSLDYWQRFLAISRVVYRDPDTAQLRLRGDNTHFVFGGDLFDKGDGDLELARDLTNLKRAYPKRVSFILGNRDVNKMKLTSLLHENAVAMCPRDVELPFFRQGDPAAKPYELFLSENSLHHSRESLLKWNLSHNMGCPTTFELRRKELQRRMSSVKDAVIDDAAVADSYLGSLAPGGALHDYLSHGQLAAILGETIFVHGCISDENVGFVPDRSLTESDNRQKGPLPGDHFVEQGKTAVEWVEALNTFCSEGVKEWMAYPVKMPSTGNRGGMFLTAYGHKRAIGEKTVMVSSFLYHGSPRFTDLRAVKFLNMSGISRICVGHQPSGDTPTIIRQPGMALVCADTSYCHKGGTRGEAVTEVLVDDTSSECTIHGIRADGERYEFDGNDARLGVRVGPDGWWTKARLGSRQQRSDGASVILLQKTTDSFFHVEHRKAEERCLVAEQLAAGDNSHPTGG